MSTNKPSDDAGLPATAPPLPHLKALRDQLDQIDGDIVRLIAERFQTVGQIIKAKSGYQDTIRYPAREREVLAKVESRARSLGLSGALARKIFSDILAHSVAIQATSLSEGANESGRTLGVALLGGTYSYDHLAAEQYLSGRGMIGRYQTCGTLEQAVEQLKSQSVDLILLPIENTFAGSMNPVYDLLREHDLNIIGEETYKIDHCLAGMADVPISMLERIYGHPHVLEQCSAFIKSLPQVRAVATGDSAEALTLVTQSQDPSHAAIAAPEGAAAHGLTILRHAVGNQDEIFCRFVALALEPLRTDPRVPCKTSLILTTRHEQGALLKCLQVLSDFGVSLTKLESRPRRNRPWEYMFFIDFEGHTEMPAVAAALDSLRAQAVYLKILGCYPSKAIPTDPQAAHLKPLSVAGVAAAQMETSALPQRLSDRAVRATDTIIRVGDLLLGGAAFTLVAGPAFVESQAQIEATARAVRDTGAHILRGNVFVSPGEPGHFTGLGFAGLEMLVAAGRAFNLPVMTEVTSPEQVKQAAEKADLLLVGARNMQNFALLAELAKVDRPVMLKRGLSSTLEEWLTSAEYIISHGNGQVILCERGIRTFDGANRSTLDLSAVVALRERTHLPVLVDPSQGIAAPSHVIPLALAARACGAQGLVVTVHNNPVEAMVGAGQSLTPAEFATLVSALSRVNP